MCLHPRPIDAIPPETARVAHAAFPHGSPYIRLRETFGPLFMDTDFADLYPGCGQPAYSPARLALILCLQFAEGLSDRQTVTAVRARIDWKYALSLPLDDPGFDPSVLSEFRDRLVAADAVDRLLTPLLERCKAAGILKPRGKQRTDATHVLAAIRRLNRVELVGETLRHALEVLAAEAPDWLGVHAQLAWAERYAQRSEEYRMPKGEAKRRALVEQMGADGRAVLAALAAPETPTALRALPAVITLQTVWAQEFEEETGRWRENERLPPGGQLRVSPYEEDARWGAKRGMGWPGYKVHLTETCDAEQPHLIVHVTTTPAAVPDRQILAPLQQQLAAQELLPATHLVDSGYLSTAAILAARPFGIDLVGTIQRGTKWQTRAGAGYGTGNFVVDWVHETVTCPQGHQGGRWRHLWHKGQEQIAVKFPAATCRACPVRSSCTRSATAPRTITLLAPPAGPALEAARARQQTAAFAETYRARAGIEGTISQAVRRAGIRRARYRGLDRVHLEHVAVAAALNLLRLDHYLTGAPPARTRTSRLSALLTPAA